MVDGHTADLEAKAAGTDVDTYTGTITDAQDVVIHDASGAVVTDNYSIKTEPGSMTITAQSINPEDEDAYLGVEIQTPEDVVYNGKEQKLAPVVTDKDGYPLKEGTDYELSYSTDNFTNAGEVTVTIDGKGNYGGRVERTYAIEKAAIEVADSATFEYNGQERVLSIDGANATGLVQGEALTLSDAQVKGTEPGVYTEVSDYMWKVVKADGTTDSTGNYTIKVAGTLTITAAEPSGDVPSGTDDGINDGADEAVNGGSNATTTKAEKADRGTAPQTGDSAIPLAAGVAIAAAAALVALLASRMLRRSARR